MYTNDYNRDSYDISRQSQAALANTVSSAMKRVYFKMTLALVVTALTALWASSSYGYLSFINKLSSVAATALFYLFAVVNGLMLCTVFLAYSPAAITKTFFITAGTFGAMSVYGYFTPNDLSKVGSFLFMALIGLIIASVVNIFLHSSTLDWIVSIAGVLIFIGLTAWDTQQIKTMAMNMPADGISKLATVGALSLYLDFINLFLFLLRIFGNRD